MDRTPASLAQALESGDTERVNEAIDAAKNLDPAERAAIYDDCFDACLEVYEAGDGYVRQSVVRLLRDAYPMPESAALSGVSGSESPVEELLADVPEETLAEQRERLLDLLVRAVADDDGRVRMAAADGLNTVGLMMHVAGLDDELGELRERLVALDDEIAEEKATQVERARLNVERYQEMGSILSGR